MAKAKKPRVLFLDIETAYYRAAVWDRYDQTVAMNQVLQEKFVLCWAAKWQGEKVIRADALHYHKKAYERDPTNDKTILKTIWDLLDAADYVVAHNGKKFDVRILNARFALHGLPPPSPYTVIDTLLLARKTFKFTSNRLDDLAQALGVGQKVSTDFGLWKAIVERQDRRAFAKMVAYNKQDIRILEGVYDKLKAWNRQQLNTGLDGCPACQSERLQKRGEQRSASSVFQRYQCQDCGHWSRSVVKLRANNQKVRSI